MNKLFVLLATTALLSACADEHIIAVQEMPFALDPTYTTKQALSGRPNCENNNWSSFEDDKGRTIVQYTCDFKGAKDYFYETYDIELEKLNERYEVLKKQKLTDLNQEKSRIERSVEESEAKLSSTQKEIEQLKKSVAAGDPSGDAEYELDNTQIYEIDLIEHIQQLKQELSQYSDDLDFKVNLGLSADRLPEEAKLKGLLVDRVTEKIQWAVTPSENIFVYAGIERELASGKYLYQDFTSKKSALRATQKEYQSVGTYLYGSAISNRLYD